MRIKFILSLGLILFLSTAYATQAEIYTEILPCDPQINGTHCVIYPKVLPKRGYKKASHCGSTLVYLSEGQKRVLNAYLRANTNVVLKDSITGQFINGPCF